VGRWRPAVDYTINAAVGVPSLTGPAEDDRPVNHVLPAWDLLTGALAGMALLAAERRRAATGAGEEVKLPLSDVALATLANLGQVAEVIDTGADRPRHGNDLFGAFGRDFATADGRRIMLVAITARQWRDLVVALGIGDAVAALERELAVDFAADEGARFRHRGGLNAIVERAVAAQNLADLERAFAGTGVCWSPYRGLHEVVAEGLVAGNPIFAEIVHPGDRRYPTPGFAATMTGAPRGMPAPAPVLGADTEEVLAEVLGCRASEIAALHDAGVVASAPGSTS